MSRDYSGYNSAFAGLVGKKLVACSINAMRNEITLETSGGKYWLEAEADCCSRSWIEHFEYAPLIGATILGVDSKEVAPSDDELPPTKFPDFQQGCDQAYFYEVRTDRASETIEMRNSSNGYYGGWLVLYREAKA